MNVRLSLWTVALAGSLILSGCSLEVPSDAELDRMEANILDTQSKAIRQKAVEDPNYTGFSDDSEVEHDYDPDADDEGAGWGSDPEPEEVISDDPDAGEASDFA